MKLISFLLTMAVLAVLDSAGAATAPAATPCTAPAHHQFDFWIGNWSVTEKGKPAGSNHIDRLLGGCALLENWVGVDGSRGHSLNFYDPRRDLWQQTWIDNSAAALNLTGHVSGGRMVLTGASNDANTHAQRIDRITWTPNADGTVRQLWDQSQDAGRTWKVVFDGLYTRKAT
ncbi:MAG TPA: hypothetical protein VF931_04010 [Steroidobacteraceae bacterium]